MTPPRSWQLELVLTSLVAGCLAGQAARRPDPVPFTRLATYALEVDEPGVAVIRDSVQWSTLWRYFGREYRSGGETRLPDSIATPPRVDFDHDMIIAVTPARRLGCSTTTYINRIESDGDRLRVVLGPDDLTRQPMFCVEPFGSMLEAAVVPREWQHVTFVEAQPAYPIPPRAPWWTRPSVDAALDSENSVLKRVSWRVLSRDSTLPLKELRRLTEGAAAEVGPANGLLANPRVTASVELLTILGRGPHPSGLAQELLFQLHGDALASDPRADTAALAMVIERLHGGDHLDIAQPLARNPVVRDDERLLRRLIQHTGGDSVTCHAALAIYASRWPLERELPSIDPRLARFSESIGCAGPPDLTRLVLPTIRVAHLCGTMFRLRNEFATGADISWDVPGTGEAGHLVLPPRGHRPYSEGWLTTLNRGTLRLYRDGRMFAIIGNSGGRTCQVSDTVPPGIPLARFFFPDDTGQWVVPASDSTVRYYRTLMRVAFYDTTGGDQVRRALEHRHATIVAGGPYPSPYILRVPDPGSTWSAFDSLLGALRDEPGVQDVFPVAVRERVRP